MAQSRVEDPDIPAGAPAGRSLGVLGTLGWLARQDDDFRAWVAAQGRWRHFRAGQTIYLAGDVSDGIYGLAQGALEVTFPLVGDQPVTVYRGESGFWIGESASLAHAVRMVSLSAARDSLVLHIPEREMLRLLDREPRHWRAFYEQSHANTRMAVQMLAEALALRPVARLARLMLRLADSDGRVQGAQEDFGRLIGMTRSSVHRALRELIDRGAVSTGYGSLRVLDRSFLERIGNET